MRGALCRVYGPPEVVQIEELPSPLLERGQVRVRVGAAAVNFPDVLILANRYQVQVPPPFVPGSEFAGEVVEVGGGVTGVTVGQRVFGATLVGAFAEEVVVRAEALTPTPVGVDDLAAAGFGVAHRTAQHVLRSVARLEAGEELVVLGAGGGVGLATVQLGALLGATVTAVASSRVKLDAATAFGAHRTVDYRSDAPLMALRELLPDGADVVVDPVGGDLSEPALRALRWGGRFVTVGYASGLIPKIPLNLVLLKGVEVVGFQMQAFAMHRPEELRRNEEELLRLFSARRAFPYIGATFGLAEAPAALRHVADGHAVGKVVLQVRA